MEKEANGTGSELPGRRDSLWVARRETEKDPRIDSFGVSRRERKKRALKWAVRYVWSRKRPRKPVVPVGTKK